MNNQPTIPDCYFSETKDICCSPQEIGSPNRKTCSLCQKKAWLGVIQNGFFICYSCLWKLPIP